MFADIFFKFFILSTYFAEKSPCVAHERIVFDTRREKMCNGVSRKNNYNGFENGFGCYCHYGQIRMDFDTCAPIRECQEIYPTVRTRIDSKTIFYLGN